jgi:sugar lactone lactonase YvrE
MRKFSSSVLAAALAFLVPQMVQAAELYVTPYSSGPIQVLDSSNGSVLNSNFTGGNVGGMTDVTFDSNANVYVAAYSANKVNRYSPAGAQLVPFQLSAPASPISVEFGPLDGALYVGSASQSTAFGNGLTRFADPSVNASTPVANVTDASAADMAFGPITTHLSQTVQPIYWTTYTGGSPNLGTVRMAYLNASGTVVGSESDFVSAASLNMNNPAGMAIDRARNFLYVGDYPSGNINRYDLTTATGGQFFAGSGSPWNKGITGMAVDSAGSLYVSSYYSQSVTKLNTGGNTGVVDTAFGDNGTVSFAYQIYGIGILEVPEPGSLALLGFGTMGLAFFRRPRGR